MESVVKGGTDDTLQASCLPSNALFLFVYIDMQEASSMFLK